MSPQTHDWERIRKYIKDAENKLIQEFLKDLERGLCSCGCGDIVSPFGDKLIEKWEAKKEVL